jgi:hypothetical protein
MERTTSIVLKLSSELSRYVICDRFDRDGALMNTIVGTPSAELKPNLRDKIAGSLLNIGVLLFNVPGILFAMTRVLFPRNDNVCNGELFLILDDEICNCDNRKYSHFQRLTTSPTALAGLGMNSGLLVGASFLWLNKRLELNHTSPIMGWVKTSHFPRNKKYY